MERTGDYYIYIQLIKKKIDSIAERFNVDPEVISTIKGFLDGVKLRFPLELFDLNEITERKLA